MNQFATAKTFKAKPSNLKKKVALVAFVVGAIAFTLGVTGRAGENGAYCFAGGLVAMIFAFRFWSMQVSSPMGVTFNEGGIVVTTGKQSETIAWGDLVSIRYKVWRGGHYWEFKSRTRKDSIDYYVDGLTSAELEDMRQTVASIQLPGVLIEPVFNPLDV